MSSPSSYAAFGASSFPMFGECTICLSDLTPSNTYAITKCGHTFHQRCIQTWLRSALSCPTCRTTAYTFNLIKLFFNNDSNDSITNGENSVAEKDFGDTLSLNRENSSRTFEYSSEDETDFNNDSVESYYDNDFEETYPDNDFEETNYDNDFEETNYDNDFEETYYPDDNVNEVETYSDNVFEETYPDNDFEETNYENDYEETYSENDYVESYYDNVNEVETYYDNDFEETLLRINDWLENGENNSQASDNSSEDERDSDNDSEVVYDANSEALSELRARINAFRSDSSEDETDSDNDSNDSVRQFLKAQIIAYRSHYNSLYSE